MTEAIGSWCQVKWYTGEVTKERIVFEDEYCYYFNNMITRGKFAPKDWCTLLN